MPKKTFHLSKETVNALLLLLQERQYGNPNALINNIVQELAFTHELRRKLRVEAIKTLESLGYNVQFSEPKMVLLTDSLPRFISRKSPSELIKQVKKQEKGITKDGANGENEWKV